MRAAPAHRAPVARVLPLLLICAACVGTQVDLSQYIEEIESSRAEREERVQKEGGWLTVAGLFWLEPGENRFGSDPDNPIVLTGDDVPAWAGSLFLADGTVRLKTAPGATVRIQDEPVTERVLRNDNEEDTDVMQLGRLTFRVIKRQEKIGVRVKDPQHSNRKNFHGLDYFPVDLAWRLDAAFERFDEPREISISNVVGTTSNLLATGEVVFELDGERRSLLPLVGDPEDTELWLIFQDRTSGKETYGFRYLYAELKDGRVDLDFNRTYNPPCAFTPYATCPLPPRENRIDARIEAGEKIYAHHE